MYVFFGTRIEQLFNDYIEILDGRNLAMAQVIHFSD